MNRVIKVYSINELKQILGELNGGYYIVAGGTDILVRLKDGRLNDYPLIDIFDVEELKGISIRDNSLIIGAGTIFDDIINNHTVKEYFNELIMAIRSIGSPQIRNHATIGGNIANASPAGDSILPLLASNARLRVVSMDNTERFIGLSDFFIGPGKTVLKKGEFIYEIVLPLNRGKGFFYKMGQRDSLAISKVSMCIRYDNVYHIALGAVYKTPMLATKTMNFLNSSTLLNDEVINKACDVIKKECFPIDDIRSTAKYRSEMVAYLLKKGLDYLKET